MHTFNSKSPARAHNKILKRGSVKNSVHLFDRLHRVPSNAKVTMQTLRCIVLLSSGVHSDYRPRFGSESSAVSLLKEQVVYIIFSCARAGISSLQPLAADGLHITGKISAILNVQSAVEFVRM
jgi:hypothetical protein